MHYSCTVQLLFMCVSSTQRMVLINGMFPYFLLMGCFPNAFCKVSTETSRGFKGMGNKRKGFQVILFRCKPWKESIPG